MDNDKFSYTYRAPSEEERRRIEDIRRDYLPETGERGEFEELVKLNAKVKRLPEIAGISVGVAGVMLFGLGFSMVVEWGMLAGGIAVSAAGAAAAAAAYPLYALTLKRSRRKYGGRILALSEKLLRGDGGKQP